MAVAIEVSFFSATQKLTNEDRGRVLTFVNKFLENPRIRVLAWSACSRPGATMSGQHASAGICAPFCSGTAKIACSCTLTITTTRTSGRQAAVLRDTTALAPCRSLNCRRSTPLAATALPVPRQGLFANYTDDYLHSLGVPQLWLPTHASDQDRKTN